MHDNLLTISSVFEWDASSHLDCYDMWLSAVTADGGQSCRDSCAIANEPLVQGMLVGKETDLLSQAQRQQVSRIAWKCSCKL